jgi:hypothetical protein
MTASALIVTAGAATTAAPTLDELAGEINAAHRACQQDFRSGIFNAMDCGDGLLTAKARMPHGSWTAWAEASLEFGPRQARSYMLLAKGRPTIVAELERREQLAKAKGKRASVLEAVSVRQALALLAGIEPARQKPSRQTPSIFTGKPCPGCGSEMIRTSSRWHTCPNPKCSGCRLHGNEIQGASCFVDALEVLKRVRSLLMRLPPEDRAAVLKQVPELVWQVWELTRE